MAAAIGETDEAERCAQFLQQLDPGRSAGVTTDAGGTGGAVLCGGREPRGSAATRRSSRSTAGRWPSTSARVLEAAGCQPVVFVGGDGDRLAATTGRQFVADTWPGEGPLGGVVDALRWFRRRGCRRRRRRGVRPARPRPSRPCGPWPASGGAAVAVADAPAPGAGALAGRRGGPASRRCSPPGCGRLHDALDALGASPVAGRRRRRAQRQSP